MKLLRSVDFPSQTFSFSKWNRKNSFIMSKNKFSIRYKSNTSSKGFKPRFNPIHIQMLSESLHRQIFGNKEAISTNLDGLKNVIHHLNSHNLWKAKTNILPEVDFNLPELHNSCVIEHFNHIATELLKEYTVLIKDLVENEVPPRPNKWKLHPGWMKYSEHEEPQPVDFPEESALVFDVEVCMKEGNYPTIATAVSNKHWYLWCSDRLADDQFSWSKDVTLSDLIPLETTRQEIKPSKNKQWTPRLIVGHNVAFDRSFIKEQYFLERTKAAFLDTMSFHMCVSGLTGLQRAMSLASQKKSEAGIVDYSRLDPSIGWSYISSLNNLADVYNLYCHGKIKKAERETFITGSLSDVRERFQEAVAYCAQDTWATLQVLKKVMPLYNKRFPHPVTLFGLLEMTSAYLPVNQNWERYLHEAQSTYDDLQKELKLSLVHVANDSCSLLQNNLYKEDPWLWNLDWSTQSIKFKKETQKSTPKRKKKQVEESSMDKNENVSSNTSEIPVTADADSIDVASSESAKEPELDPSIKQMYHTATSLRKIRPFLPGYPAWYRDLCDKKASDQPDWEHGPYLISSQMRCVPKLLRMTWDGFPLHYDEKHGWGYLVPDPSQLESTDPSDFPLVNFLKIVENISNVNKQEFNIDSLWSVISEPKENRKEESELWKAILQSYKYKDSFSSKRSAEYGNGPLNVGIKGCLFFRLPHKDGVHKRVGNPLSKDFLPKVEDGTLKTVGKGQADRALLLSKMLSYWKNAHDRIVSQMVVWFNDEELSETVKCSESYNDSNKFGAILPRLVPAGTVTRRAVEPTWLTASNAYEDRVGSELKAMIQAPPGYHFVGADVDSQELWLAAVFGDSQFAKMHGCTAFGWMTLQGKKSEGTDMHSKTASSVGISRDQAKILNYARIYGAGKTFAQRLLMQFNHRLSLEEAKAKVKKIYTETKGLQKFVLSEDQMDDKGLIFIPGEQRKVWTGGSESHMFNKLEEIALSPTPSTPALSCRISRALEPKAVDKNFMTSRVNWVVQSSAVDFLHLMLVCMKWLFNEFNIDGRFSISIHDEVRYLVRSEDRYRAALALQITNLLTRSFFTSKLGINDLPQSVAFFSSVDIDKVLRKEVHMDSVTPSNPHGLEKGYGIPPGEALDIFDILEKTNGKLMERKS